MDYDELKRKLRQLKKFEAQVRFKNIQTAKYQNYIWDQYFSTRNEKDTSVKYDMITLLCMEYEQLKETFNEFFYCVYFQYYKENGMTIEGMYDSKLLSVLGLPLDSSIETIKNRFRELAKKYHPDMGGDSSKFIELMDTYKKLIGDK